MSTHNLFLSRNMKIFRIFSSENFHFLVVKFSVYLNRLVLVMHWVPQMEEPYHTRALYKRHTQINIFLISP